ncbi:MAG TPA: hypothetical protein VHD61_09590 [Lacunisphaera sp.]|nr:hypothetical protein [Lacunisphaera sp.]
MRPRKFLRLVLAGLALAPALRAWDHPGHSIVNQIALNSLPADFPAFVREPANVERIKYLAGEPDRWSHSPDLPLAHDNWPEHYLDYEELAAAGLDLNTVPGLRYDFVLAFAAGRAAHPENFRRSEPLGVTLHTDKLPGLLPWVITETYGKLKAAFTSLHVYEELGTPDEVANARANVVYQMAILGHYVGDSAQPLHTTIYHNGWAGDNPHGYTTWTKFHSWIDSGLINKSHLVFTDVAPRIVPAATLSLAPRPDGRDPVFVASLDFIAAQNKLVEPLYQLEKDGKLGNQDPKQAVSPEGRALIENQLLKGGEQLGALWLAAWRNAPVTDAYLHGVLQRRVEAAAKNKP